LKKLASLLGLIVLVFVLSSCFDDDSDSSSVNVTELEGTWTESTFRPSDYDTDEWEKQTVFVSGNNIIFSGVLGFSAAQPTTPDADIYSLLLLQ